MCKRPSSLATSSDGKSCHVSEENIFSSKTVRFQQDSLVTFIEPSYTLNRHQKQRLWWSAEELFPLPCEVSQFQTSSRALHHPISCFLMLFFFFNLTILSLATCCLVLEWAISFVIFVPHRWIWSLNSVTRALLGFGWYSSQFCIENNIE